MDIFKRHLHIADNIKILRNFRTESVDLIYLDPPFNSGKQWENPVQVEMGKKLHKLNPKIGEDLYKRIDLFSYDKNDLKANLYTVQSKKCIGCGKEKEKEDMDLDHIIPRERGGQNEPRNFQLLCRTCNSSKTDKTQTAWRREVLQKRLKEDMEKEIAMSRERRRKIDFGSEE